MTRRPDGVVLRWARQRRKLVAVVLVAVAVALTGAHQLGGGVRAQGRLAVPDEATGAPAGTDCRQQAVRIVSPSDGVSLRPGRVVVVGVGPGSGQAVRWRLHDASGARLSAGVADTATLADTAAFLVPLELAAGSYRVEVAEGGLTALRPDALACPAARISLTVTPDLEGPTWLSGASGVGVPDGQFAAWRGAPLPMAGTWADNNEAQVGLWQLRSGEEFGDWAGDMDIAIGAIDDRLGETWAAAARGEYDARWARSLRELARLWAGRPGTLYVRFAHEMNGDWFSWGVTRESVDDFVVAWRRFRTLQQQHFPAARLVFSPNFETPDHLGLDWRDLFPGADQVDVVSTCYYNAYPATQTAEEFWDLALATDEWGAPRGIVQHLEFARSVGLPFAVSEWGPHAGFGDAGAYVEQMYQFFRANAGTGPGQVLYEVLFNVDRDDNTFALMPSTRSPEAAEAYRRLW